MLREILVKAPAKVNLGLRVLKKRSDGFHEIKSIFTAVNLCDELSASLSKNDGECVIECDGADLPEQNTIFAAYKAFCSIFNIYRGVFFRVKKVIPCGAGLGGGSSDAAAALKALCDLNGISPSLCDLEQAAAQIGSDVFFFVHVFFFETNCAFVTGRGEKIFKIECRSDLYFLLIFPKIHSSTKKAYEFLEKNSCTNLKNDVKLDELEKIYRKNPSEWTFANDFSLILAQKYPQINEALADIRKADALWLDMSGSGAAVFGVFTSFSAAKAAFETLKEKWDCHLCLQFCS